MKNDELTTTNEKPKGVQFPEDLSLRDYFAAKAMQGLVQNNEFGAQLQRTFDPEKKIRSGDNDGPQEYLSAVAYSIADAMLRARNGGAS